jgi:hypothetical protein
VAVGARLWDRAAGAHAAAARRHLHRIAALTLASESQQKAWLALFVD